MRGQVRLKLNLLTRGDKLSVPRTEELSVRDESCRQMEKVTQSKEGYHVKVICSYIPHINVTMLHHVSVCYSHVCLR